MATTMVRAHTRGGHAVRTHARRTRDRAVSDELLGPLSPVSQIPDACFAGGPHPARYPIFHVDGHVTHYACTDCAATWPVEQEASV